MVLSIKDPEADRLARQLASLTGESLTQAVLRALRERLQRESGRRRGVVVRDEIARIQNRITRLPVLNERSDEEILGYDENGIPH